MPRLKSANFAVTELASGITNAATSFQVVDASLFPNEGPFIVLVHDSTPGFAGVREIMEVGSINKGTNTFSNVLRGREGTSAVAHSAGARAECVWTAGTHEELVDTDIKPARFVIGTSEAGWTEKDCDYLCDGTDDQEEIIQALNDLPATGGEVVILDGTYNITASINIPKDNVSLRGNGNATTLKRMYDSTGADSGPTARGLITLNEKSGCKIQGLQIDGNRATYTASHNSGIYLYSSSDNTVTGNTCNNSNYGIYLYSSSDNTVTGNTCNNNNGIYLNLSSNNTVTGNTCNNNNYYGIFLDSSSNNTVTGNTFNNNNNGIYLNLSSNENTVTGNTCNNNSCGIFLESSSNNTITGNTCNNNNYYGIFLLDASSNNTITGNTCNNSSCGIYLSSSSDNTVTGNTCNNNNTGISLSSSSNNTITGNTCNNNSYGIYMYSSSDNIVTSNTCNNNSNSGIYLFLSSDNTITGNTYNNNNRYGIELFLSSNNTVTGNTCIRGTGQTSDYASNQYTIRLQGIANNYNLISSNNCMGKAPVVEGGTGNTVFNNKWDKSSDFEDLKAEVIAHKADNAPNPRGNQIYHVEVVSSSVSETPDAGRIIFDTSQGKFFGGNGTEWV
jgi:parallel beta-helix repeat protein